MALDLLAPLPAHGKAAPARFVDDRDGALALLEIADGNADVIGPAVSHDEATAIARQLLAVAGPGCWLPPVVHKLCLAYLASRGERRLA